LTSAAVRARTHGRSTGGVVLCSSSAIAPHVAVRLGLPAPAASHSDTASVQRCCKDQMEGLLAAQIGDRDSILRELAEASGSD
jgi:hypothetical protein